MKYENAKKIEKMTHSKRTQKMKPEENVKMLTETVKCVCCEKNTVNSEHKLLIVRNPPEEWQKSEHVQGNLRILQMILCKEHFERFVNEQLTPTEISQIKAKIESCGGHIPD